MYLLVIRQLLPVKKVDARKRRWTTTEKKYHAKTVGVILFILYIYISLNGCAIRSFDMTDFYQSLGVRHFLGQIKTSLVHVRVQRQCFFRGSVVGEAPSHSESGLTNPLLFFMILYWRLPESDDLFLTFNVSNTFFSSSKVLRAPKSIAWLDGVI